MNKLDSMKKVGEAFNVYRYDNGWMVEINGRDKEGDYATAKIICNTEKEVMDLFTKFNSMEVDR